MEVKKTIDNLAETSNNDSYKFVKDSDNFWIKYGNVILFLFLLAFLIAFFGLASKKENTIGLNAKLICNTYSESSVFDNKNKCLVISKINYKDINFYTKKTEAKAVFNVGNEQLTYNSLIIYIDDKVNEDYTVDLFLEVEESFFNENPNIIMHNYPVTLKFISK